jgi:hypothetical protein
MKRYRYVNEEPSVRDSWLTRGKIYKDYSYGRYPNFIRVQCEDGILRMVPLSMFQECTEGLDRPLPKYIEAIFLIIACALIVYIALKINRVI